MKIQYKKQQKKINFCCYKFIKKLNKKKPVLQKQYRFFLGLLKIFI